LLADFEGRWGDRRQELYAALSFSPSFPSRTHLFLLYRVFIGEQLEVMRPLLTAELDAALLNDEEWKDWEKVMKSKKTTLKKKIEKLEKMYDDGFEDWIDEADEEVMEALGGHAHPH
jgi:hypothetical protein